jgi:hypothetical protein
LAVNFLEFDQRKAEIDTGRAELERLAAEKNAKTKIFQAKCERLAADMEAAGDAEMLAEMSVSYELTSYSHDHQQQRGVTTEEIQRTIELGVRMPCPQGYSDRRKCVFDGVVVILQIGAEGQQRVITTWRTPGTQSTTYTQPIVPQPTALDTRHMYIRGRQEPTVLYEEEEEYCWEDAGDDSSWHY